MRICLVEILEFSDNALVLNGEYVLGRDAGGLLWIVWSELGVCLT